VRVEEARDAAFSTRRAASAVTHVTDPLDGVISLIGRDGERAAAFIKHELGAIEALGDRAERLLETLEVFLKHGQRVANASAITGRHRDTVHRHLREIEELLGCKVEERSADLLWALRLRARFRAAELPRRAVG
jgi:DNA-binding PucR family transcriptional regulator